LGLEFHGAYGYDGPADESIPLTLKRSATGFHWLMTQLLYSCLCRCCATCWIAMRSGLPATPLLVGGDSPALERYRAARAELLKLDRRLREEDLLDRGRVHDRLGQAAGILRGAAETLQRQYGPEAHAVFAKALDDAVAELKRRILVEPEKGKEKLNA